ncbi:hypothetical protein [Moorella naiadis (nom. illeg.)]|uniref:hypothetical protein n=1 Tax=Moorella naiadis (nom. illeg.) TaxID=3093670 RepID=UPI003D9CA49D
MAVLLMSMNTAEPDPVVRTFHTARQALIAKFAAKRGVKVSEERTGCYIDMYCEGSTAEIAELLKAIYFETHLTNFVVDLEEGENPVPLRELRKLNESLVELTEEEDAEML